MSANIDVILGRIPIIYFTEGKLVGNTFLAATGKYGEYTGHVTIEFDEVQKTNR